MANQALIQASRGAGEQFIDYGAVMQPAITGILKEMEVADNKMARFINSLPPGANIEKLPEGMRPEVERYLRDSKEEYAAAADVASKLSPRDPGYREALDKMNSIKIGFINLNKNLESHLANRVEFIQDKDDLSTSLNYNDNKFLTSVYAGDYDGFKVTSGELEFFDKAKGRHVRTPEFPQYSLRDIIGANRVGKMFNVYTKAGENGKMWSQERAKKDVGTIFREAGVQGVIDMAFDGFDEESANYVDTVVKQLVAPNMSDQDWLASNQRENLKTKEGFAPYRQGFQKFVTEIVKDGWEEGNSAYNSQQSEIQATKTNKYGGFAYVSDTGGDSTAGIDAFTNISYSDKVARRKSLLNLETVPGAHYTYKYDKNNEGGWAAYDGTEFVRNMDGAEVARIEGLMSASDSSRSIFNKTTEEKESEKSTIPPIPGGVSLKDIQSFKKSDIISNLSNTFDSSMFTKFNFKVILDDYNDKTILLISPKDKNTKGGGKYIIGDDANEETAKKITLDFEDYLINDPLNPNSL